MAVVIPPTGQLRETAQQLLALVGPDVHLVRTVGNGTSFEVPDEVADAYHGTPAKPVRRRGRAPKISEEG